MSVNRVVLTGFMHGQTIQNVLHVLNADGLTSLSAIADDFQNFWLQEIRKVQVSDFIWQRIDVSDQSIANSGTFTKAISIQGNMGGNFANPTFMAFVLRLRTALGGRAARGRIYVAGVGSDWTQKSLIRSDILTLWQVPLTNLTNRYTVSGNGIVKLCIASHRLNPTPFAVTSLSLNPVIGIQRRRNVGVGI